MGITMAAVNPMQWGKLSIRKKCANGLIKVFVQQVMDADMIIGAFIVANSDMENISVIKEPRKFLRIGQCRCTGHNN